MCQICATFAPQLPTCSYAGLTTDPSDGSGPLSLPGETSLENGDAIAGTGTNAGIGAGEFFLGELSSNGDSDWIEITLDAGTYTIAAVGVGALDNALNDSFLRLRDAAGNHDPNDSNTSNDDGAPGFNSELTVTVSATTTFYIDVQSYDNSDSGTYGVSVTEGTVASYNDEMIAGNLMRPGQAWTTVAGTGGQEVTWAFRASGSPGDDVPLDQMDANQRLLTEESLEYLEGISGLNFTQVNSGGTSDNATMLFGAYSANDGAGAFAYFPGSTAGGIRTTSSAAGDVWINNNSAGNSYNFGSYNFYTMLHELGHAIGLAHPGDYNAGDGGPISYGNSAGFIQDSTQYTVMSYFDETNTGASGGLSYPDTFMLHDFMAIHALYGADVGYNAGNTVYGFNASEADSAYDFTENQNPFMTVYDGQGTDTIDLSGYAMAQNLTLEEGIFSNVGGYVGNFSIAFGAVIENAIGGSGDDTITGNAVANSLEGGVGEDTLDGGAGNDMLDGGSGADMIDGGAGQDTVSYENAGSGALRVSLGGTAGIGGQSEGDVLSNIEHATGSNFADQIIGSGVANELQGLDGSDTILGGAGDDTINGGDDDDIIIGGEGADSIIGGGGIDTARYASSTAVVVDLSLGQGSGGEAAGDTLTGIENVAGSQFGDTLIGNTGANVFDGLGGNDAFRGGLGADMINGDLGFDTAFYNDSTVGVDIGLFRDGTGGTAEGDVLRGVEGLFGSDFADTLVGSGAYALVTLSGGAGDDLLFDYGGTAQMFGGAGNDTMIGRLGADEFDGGDDIDVVRYADAIGAVNANLATGVGTGADAEGDTFVDVENLVGSIFFDTLTGDDGVNDLRGGAGRDTITGGGGNDQLYGEADLDTFVFDSLDWGDDLIFDFDANPGREQLDFSATSLEFSDFTITDTAFGLRIDYADITAADGFSSIALANVEVSQITADDFIFAV